MFEGNIVIIFCTVHVTRQIDYRTWDNSVRLPKRMTSLIASYNERGTFQVNEVTPLRSKHEESAHFEMGYVMSEILERYRKLVGLVQRPVKYKIDSVLDVVKNTEMIQGRFLEIFHLVNMMNEIPRKYGYTDYMMKDNQDRGLGGKGNGTRMEDLIKGIEEIQRIREKEKKKRLKQQKKDREMWNKGILTIKPQKSRKPGNKWWPIDYGWEIDYKWF